MQLTEHFTLEEMTVSEAAPRFGIDNSCPSVLIPNLVKTAMHLEAIRTLLKTPINVVSGYRRPELNKIIGGSDNSAHLLGLAVDIYCPRFDSPAMTAILINDNIEKLEVDQVILEFGRWVHVGYSTEWPPRNAALTIRNKNEGYLRGILV